jgi:alginate biosynthesis protein AlgX
MTMPGQKGKFLALASALLLLAAAPAAAQQMSPEALHGYRTYLKHHPPKPKAVKRNLYPFPGPVIAYGQDIPICPALKNAATYENKSELRYLHHGRDGWTFRTIDFRTDFAASPETLAYFTRLNNMLEARGQTLVLAFQPTRAMVTPSKIDPADKPEGYTPEKAWVGYQAFLKQLRDAGLRAPDLSAGAREIAYFPKGDFHWNSEGAADAARKLAAAIKDLPAYKDIKQQDFESRVVGLGPADRGSFEEFIQKTCKVNIELTSEPMWETSAKNAASSAASLLGNASPPPVTVLGTSNSSEDSRFNFVGALSHYLRSDVYNAAVLGGGFGTSPDVYYASDEYHRSPPKIIVWEFLPQHNYNDQKSRNAFRQMIPAVQGVCGEKETLARHSGKITAGEFSLFPEMAKRPVRDTYLYLNMQDPDERTVKVEVLYTSGDADQVDLSRTTRIENNGKYFLELAGKGDDSVLSFKVVTDPPRGQVEARLCSYPLKVAGK